ncbi:hypothetical protein [Stenoxybacter acetivorans]|uniref:hypothetical protein n=1 Tax=Stenoxybacter acetivorans TaxID=422441 RepID=UPI0012EB5B78|nr:hypothetical protein [Stenoxybacter acetivorans]
MAELLKYGRVNFLTEADFQENSELDKVVKNIIGKIQREDALIRENQQQMRKIQGASNG